MCQPYFSAKLLRTKSKKTVEIIPQSVFTVLHKKQAFPISASVAVVLSRSPGLRINASISFPVSQWMHMHYRRFSFTVAGPHGLLTHFPS